jgi:hypothetical protein
MSANRTKALAPQFWRQVNALWKSSIGTVVFLSLLTVSASAQWVLSPLYQNTAGTVDQIAMTTLKTGWVVTAVSNSTTNLEVIAWNDTGTALKRTGSATGDKILALWGVAVTTLDSSRVVTAAVSFTTGHMELTVWKISSTGAVSQQGKTYSGGLATAVSVAALDSGRVVTGFQNNNGDLTVKAWKISSTGVITPQGSYSAGTATSISIVGLNASQVVTAFRNGSYDLELAGWSIDSSGKVTRQGIAKAGAVGKVAISYWAPYLVTASETSAAGLAVDTWSVDASGDIAQLYGTTTGSAFGVALCVFPTEPNVTLPFTAVENSHYDLSLVAWNSVPEEPGVVEELATHVGTSYVDSQLAAVPEGPGKPYFIVTAVRNKGSNLVVKVWQLYEPTPE